ncbi:MAG: hypothetical protein ACJAZO_001463 [Myxococcota bacterium]|jgi:hypothetical protein
MWSFAEDALDIGDDQAPSIGGELRWFYYAESASE